MKYLFFILYTMCVFFLSYLLPVNSNAQAIYSDTSEILSLGKHTELFTDYSNSLELSQVIHSSKFTKNTHNVPNPGIIPESTVWIKITITNQTKSAHLILQLEQATIDEVDFFQYNSTTSSFTNQKLGEYKAFGLRTYLTPEYLFDVNIPYLDTRTFYFKVRCKENMQLPISISTPTTRFNQSVLKSLISGIYIGIMLVMLLYNLFIYFSIRDKSYLYYTFYIVCILLTQTNLQGYPFQFLWPNTPWMAIHGSFLFPVLVGMAALEFFKEFLRTKERIPKMHQISLYLLIPYVISILLSLTGFYSISYQIMEINAGIVSIFMLTASIIIYKMGNREARFFLIGWSVFLIGICIYILKDYDILPYNNFTRYTMHFGSGIEVVLLSFALADKINILKREKEKSQAEVFEALQENKTLITKQNIVLERKVKERTYELSTTLKNLKDTQAQLVDAEKMASLGQLTAGIAHEINNPINFVSANVRPLQLDIDDILSLIRKYENLNPKENIEDQLHIIELYKKQIDLNYLEQEIKTLLHGISDGAYRTAEIVKGLRNFSRLDEGDVKTANLNEGIESTLTILRSAMPNNIKVVLNLGDIPLIECYAGKLNQVFLNAINNSVHAMQKNKTLSNHTLTISTYELKDSVCVSVEDSGIGMNEEVKQKMFEPFFTTKDVGEGTGLGMSIVFKIIESHNGKIDVQSELTKGTKITFTLPKKLTIS